MRFTAQSTAVYSTWFHAETDLFLIDAGEGVASSLGIGKISALKSIFLTHDHWDHIAGLVQLLNLRARMATANALTIYYPVSSHKLDAIRSLFPDRATWTPLVEGHSIPVTQKRFVTFFPVRHARGAAVGYKLWEKRARKKPEFDGCSREELTSMAIKISAEGGTPEFSEPFDHHIITYTGDTMPLSDEEIGRPELLVHEASFATDVMRAGADHSILPEALEAAERSGAKMVVLNHLSTRYREVPRLDLPSHIYPLIPKSKPFTFDLS